MLATDHEQTPRPRSNVQPRRKGPPPFLRIDTPAQKPAILVLGDSSASASSLSSATSESDFSPPFAKPNKSRPMRNTKKLSLTLPSAHSNVSSNSLVIASDPESIHVVDDSTHLGSAMEPKRRASLASIPTRLHRKDEDDSSISPYATGPVQVLPGVWLGSEDNAQNWKDLQERGIRSILNVAKEVNLPFDTMSPQQPPCAPILAAKLKGEVSTYYPAHTERPAMHYLKLPWSHGQPDLVNGGFVAAMAFVDTALSRGDGVLIHCQCGVSRSATVVIALVMRAAALSLPSAPPEVWALKGSGFSGAYDFVKEKSSCIGPNMSLIYQLHDYQSTLNNDSKTPSGSEHSSVIGDDEEEWSRQRRLMDEETDGIDVERESVEVLQEAYALDRAMEDRIVARKVSGSSLGSSTGIGMGPAWKSRYGNRKRTGSIASNFTTGSVISEDLVEEEEEEELLGIGGGFDAPSIATRSASGETTEEEINGSPDWKKDKSVISLQIHTPSTAKPSFPGKQRSLNDLDRSLHRPPPSAPATKTSFGFAARLPFKPRPKVKPSPLFSLPPVPSSPDVPAPPEELAPSKVDPVRRRAPPPLLLKNSTVHTRSSSRSSQLSQSSINTPSQTLFVFPPEPTIPSNAPHMVTVTSSLNIPLPLSAAPTPRVSTFKLEGRKRSFIGLAVPPTPTTACSRVDARGWVSVGSRGV
ncbi:hypothetical protein DFH11DRAFT_1499260 [Phellopilus nigrolimitatus]|nr:hypothetical protein DFH11DRAFT_1499260 [Phellopilus nigrolimitatus]